jgi:hypothetical protein
MAERLEAERSMRIDRRTLSDWLRGIRCVVFRFAAGIVTGHKYGKSKGR